MTDPIQEWAHLDYAISTDPDLIDVDLVHRFLSEDSYWAMGRDRRTVELSIASSVNFGAYDGSGSQVGGARVVTDGITFGWLCDLFVLQDHRGRGLGRALVRAVITHPDLSNVKRLLLATADAHELYRTEAGFEPLGDPERWMVRLGSTA